MQLFEHPFYQEDLCAAASWIPSEWMGANVLIAGATGLIGSFLVDVLVHHNRSARLEAEKINVCALARGEETLRRRFRHCKEDDRVCLIAHDITTALNCEIKFDYIFHAASNTHPLAYASDPIGTITANVMGLYNLLSYAATKPARRVIFFSSVEIYGENRGDVENFDESYCGYIDCNTLRAGYPESKRLGESLCQAFVKQNGMDIVIPRIPRTYGASMRRQDSKALAQFIQKAAIGEDVVLKSKGTQLFSYCYIADVATALFVIASRGICGDAYNIADGQSDIALRRLAELVADATGVNLTFELPGDIEKTGYSAATKALMNASKLKSLGWAPAYDIESGLRRTIAIWQGTQDMNALSR